MGDELFPEGIVLPGLWDEGGYEGFKGGGHEGSRRRRVGARVDALLDRVPLDAHSSVHTNSNLPGQQAWSTALLGIRQWQMQGVLATRCSPAGRSGRTRRVSLSGEFKNCGPLATALSGRTLSRLSSTGVSSL